MKPYICLSNGPRAIVWLNNEHSATPQRYFELLGGWHRSGPNIFAHVFSVVIRALTEAQYDTNLAKYSFR